MKALLSTLPGGPETLTYADCPDPIPGDGEVVIRVAACGLNFFDSLIIADRYQVKPQRPFAPGGEVSGVVERVGAGVEHLKAGDRVVAYCGHGGLAEELCLPAVQCAPVPASMAMDVAAGFVLTYGTSLHALKDRAALKTGETLLVLGASGGVGLAAVELGKALGARVIAAVSTPDKRQVTLDHGADDAIVYPRGPFDAQGRKDLARLFKDACGAKGADVIYDPVGGDYAEAALRAIAWEGRFLVVGFAAGLPKIPLNLPLLKSCQIVGVHWGAAIKRDWPEHLANLDMLFRLHEGKELRPFVSARYGFGQAREAIAQIASRQATGKLVVIVNERLAGSS